MTDPLTVVVYFLVGIAGVLVIAGLEFLAAWLIAVYGDHKWRKRAERRGGYLFDHADYPHEFVPFRHD